MLINHIGSGMAAAFFAACGLFPSAVLAAGGQDIFKLSLDELSRMVVTDTKIPQSYDNVIRKVRVLTPEQMELQPGHNRNISELLQYLPGQFVNTLSRNDASWGSYGGLGPKYNGYFLDGLPIDSFADAMSLDPWAFARIELYEGPAVVMYPNYLTMDFAGNESPLGGITNILLKDRVEEPATRMDVGAGDYGTFNGRFYHQDSSDGLNYFFGAAYERSNYTDYGTGNSWLHILQDPEYKKTKAYAKVSWLGDDSSVSVFAHHAQHSGFAGRPNRDFDNGYDTVNAAYSGRLGAGLTMQLKSGYRGYDRRWAEDNYPVLSLREHDGTRQNIYPSDLAFTLEHGSGLLTFGGDYQAAFYRTYSETAGSRAAGNRVDAYSEGVYAQEKLILQDWVLRAGGRYTNTHHCYALFNGVKPADDSNSWNKVLWSVGARRKFNGNFSVYANSGSGMTAPSAKQLGGTLLASDAGVPGKNGQLPNPGLKAESGISSDLGADYKPLSSLTLGVRLFLSRVSDAIIENAVSSSPSQTRSANAGKITSRGVEASAEQELTGGVSWFANITQTYTDVSNPSDADQDGVAVPFVPYYMANIGASVKPIGWLTVSPYVRVIGKYYDGVSRAGRGKAGPYQITNLRLLAELERGQRHTLRAGVDLDNLFDRRYVMPWQFKDPGFNASAFLQLEF